MSVTGNAAARSAAAWRCSAPAGRLLTAADGSITVKRSDIYGGKIVPFVPFTKLEGDKIVGSHNR